LITTKYVICNNVKKIEMNDILINEKNTIFLGKWCVSYNEIKKYKNFEFFDFIWKDRKKYEEAYWYLLNVFEDILEALYRKINSSYNLSFDKTFYRIILSTWLIHYIHQIYDKFITIKKFTLYYKGKENINFVFLIDNNNYIPLNYQDFINKIIFNESYNAQQYHKVINYFNLEKKFITIIDKKRQQVTFNYSQNFFNKLKNKCYHFFNFINKNEKIATIVNPYFLYSKTNDLKLLFKSNFRVILNDFDFNVNFDLKICKEKRNQTIFENPEDIKDDFYDFLNQNILQEIPLIYFENINKIINFLNKQKIPKTKVYYTANAHYSNDFFKFYIAMNKKNIKTVISQHGGVNGTHLLSLEEIDHKLADYIFTFGWKERVNEIPMYSFNISTLIKKFKYKPKKNNLLFISTAAPRRIFRFYSCYSGDEFENLIFQTIDFFNFLDEKINIIYRKYPVHLGWFTEEIIQNNINKKIKFDRNKKIIESYKNAEIVVSNYLGSTYLETLSLNIPTIIFCDEKITKFRKSAQDIYEKLKKVNILHNDGKSAAQFLNYLYNNKNNLYEWWNSYSTQKVRLEFVNRYSNVTDSWYEEIILKLKDISNEINSFKTT